MDQTKSIKLQKKRLESAVQATSLLPRLQAARLQAARLPTAWLQAARWQASPDELQSSSSKRIRTHYMYVLSPN